MKIAIIGAGNMGGATARGLAVATKNEIYVSNPSQGKLDDLQKEFPNIQVSNSNTEYVGIADLVILAVKPWKIEGVLNEIMPQIDLKRTMIASFAGGISAADIQGMTHQTDARVFHIIPNTAIAVRQSMTFISAAGTTDNENQQVVDIFRQLGDALLIEERLMGAGMALASCGIAYVMRYIRAAMEGGVELGMYPKDAQRIVQQTMRGAVELLEATGGHPEQEVDKVTTPGGFTIRGLNAMEAEGFTKAVIAGLKASVK